MGFMVLFGCRGVDRANVEQFYLDEMVPHRIPTTGSWRLLNDPIPFYSDKSTSHTNHMVYESGLYRLIMGVDQYLGLQHQICLNLEV
jgi:hypothetical protein